MCTPTNKTGTEVKREVLFKAEFSNLFGSGKIKVASTVDKTGEWHKLEKKIRDFRWLTQGPRKHIEVTGATYS